MQTMERPESEIQSGKSERYQNAEAEMQKQRAIIAEINKNAGNNIELFDLEDWQNAYESLLTQERVIIDETYKDPKSLDYKKALLKHYSRAMNAYISNQEDDPHVNKQRNRQPGIIERIGEVYFSDPDRSLDDLEKKLHDASNQHIIHKSSFLKTQSEIKKMELNSLQSKLGDIENASPTEQLDFFQKSIESLKSEKASLEYEYKTSKLPRKNYSQEANKIQEKSKLPEKNYSQEIEKISEEIDKIQKKINPIISSQERDRFIRGDINIE